MDPLRNARFSEVSRLPTRLVPDITIFINSLSEGPFLACAAEMGSHDVVARNYIPIPETLNPHHDFSCRGFMV